MRADRTCCLVVVLVLAWARLAEADYTLKVDCTREPQKFAAGLLPAVRPVDGDGNGTLDEWVINNDFGEISSCDDVDLPCGPLWHHTGEDHLVNRHTWESGGKEIYAMDNGVVVFSAMQAGVGGLVLIKHVAPPATLFEIPAYRETLEYEDDTSRRVTISYPREFTPEVVTYYLHLGHIYVGMGDSVSRGQAIGRTYTLTEMAQREYVYDPHLHLEIWRKCTATENQGYEVFGTNQFQDAATNQIVRPAAIIKANEADRELVRLLPVQLPSPGSNVTIMGAEFGPSPGIVWVSGKVFPLNSQQLWPITVSSTNWTDSEIRLNLYQGPLVSPFHLISPLLFEVNKASGKREGSFFYPFKDVEPDDWFSGSVINLWKHGLIEGASGLVRFLPDEPIKRSEFVKLLAQAVCPQGASRCDPVSGAPAYTDVKPGDWFYEHVRTAWSQNWLDRTQAQFRPHDPIARAEVAKIIALVLRIPLQTPASSPYSDVGTTDWFAPHVVGLTNAGYLNGYSDRKFQPGASITRAEAASLIDRVRLGL